MEQEKLREYALTMLADLESWVEHSDEARYRLFPEMDDVDDAFALTVLAWLRQQIRPEDGTMIIAHWTVEQVEQISGTRRKHQAQTSEEGSSGREA